MLKRSITDITTKSVTMKKVSWIYPIVFAAIIFFISTTCKKDEPESLTQPATNLSKTGATLNGTVNPNGLSTTVTFEYGTTTSYDSSVTAVQSPVNGDGIKDVSADITGLTIGTTYHYRVKAENSHWTLYSNDNEFEYGYPPVATTLGVTNSKSIVTTLNGTVYAGGLSTIVTFEYGTTTGYDRNVIARQSPVAGDSIRNENVSAEISGLIPCTTYHFRVKAENSFGTSYGSDLTFDSSELPALTTYPISGITATTAISGGSISDEGCTDITERGVYWGTKKFFSPRNYYGKPISFYIITFTHFTHDSTGTGTFTSNLTGLNPSTTYYVKAYARNSSGTAYGDTISFKTSSK
jgi:hypothetical protein